MIKSSANSVAHWRHHCGGFNCDYVNLSPEITTEERNLSSDEWAKTPGQVRLQIAHERGNEVAAYAQSALLVVTPPSNAEEVGYATVAGVGGYVVYKLGSKLYKVFKTDQSLVSTGNIPRNDPPYSSRSTRSGLDDVYGEQNVSSTTIPPINAKNVKLAGQRHPVTGIVFDLKGFPIFDDVAVFDTRLPIEPFQNASYTDQMKMASRDLAKALRKGQISPSKFSEEQLSQINKGSSKIDGYTWHHHQDTGRMQLVPEFEHGKTGHVGWESMHRGQ